MDQDQLERVAAGLARTQSRFCSDFACAEMLPDRESVAQMCRDILSLIFPGFFMDMFQTREMSVAEFAPIRQAGTVLLRFIAVYSLFDAIAVILYGALKGAGDTRFVMWTMSGMSLGVMVVPVFLAIEHVGAGLYVSWIFITLYIASLTGVFWLRFRQGGWKHMSVIEETATVPNPLAG